MNARLTRSVFLLPFVVLLSGCYFTHQAQLAPYARMRKVEHELGGLAHWVPPIGARLLVCPLRCGGASPVWSLPGPGDSLYVSLPDSRTSVAWLRDTPGSCPVPAPGEAPPLELVVASKGLVVAPLEIDGLPTRAVLELQLRQETWLPDMPWTMVQDGSSLLYRREGVSRKVVIEVDFSARRAANEAGVFAGSGVVTGMGVVLDVVTSPIQAALYLAAFPVLVILSAGLGGHRW